MQATAFTLVLFALPIALTQSSGSSGCPCIDTLTTYGLADDQPLTATIAEQEYSYPAGYGLGCNQHDNGLLPYCTGGADDPSWCADSWCYVDPGNCNLVTSQGTYFTSDLFFSYRTCGNTNTYSLWFELPQHQHQLVELVELFVFVFGLSGLCALCLSVRERPPLTFLPAPPPRHEGRRGGPLERA